LKRAVHVDDRVGACTEDQVQAGRAVQAADVGDVPVEGEGIRAVVLDDEAVRGRAVVDLQVIVDGDVIVRVVLVT
jgi:hypothetical protein